jgi:hypothetical protein
MIIVKALALRSLCDSSIDDSIVESILCKRAGIPPLLYDHELGVVLHIGWPLGFEVLDAKISQPELQKRIRDT